MLLRARIVLPVSRPAIENGALHIVDDRIEAVGSWDDLRKSVSHEEVIDLGDSILMPGLINAHCHLDYTDMAGHILPPKTFPDWIKAILALKAGWSYSEFAHSWVRGAKMLLESGTTTVADIEAVPELLPEVWSSTPLRVHSFLELTNVKSRRRAGDILHEAMQKIQSLRDTKNKCGISPHALYSTTPELLKLSACVAQQTNWGITTHVAESVEEFDMYQHGRGPLFDWLKTQRDMSDCGERSPIGQLDYCGMLSEKFLAVHVNYLGRDDAERLGKSGASVVHCPKSHQYFAHQEFQRKKLERAGVNICLGTDSLASAQTKRRKPATLNMFSEMQVAASASPELTPEQLVQMATINGARALGLQGQAGELTTGALADVIAIPFNGKISTAYEAVLANTEPVIASVIDGQWAIGA